MLYCCCCEPTTTITTTTTAAAAAAATTATTATTIAITRPIAVVPGKKKIRICIHELKMNERYLDRTKQRATSVTSRLFQGRSRQRDSYFT